MERNQKVEDYMRTIYRLRENGLVRGAYIARELGVSKPTVCVALKEMEAAGYLSVQSDRTVELTEKGEKIGKSVIERNRVIFGLLTDLGVDKSIADADACKMEHGISDETLRALIELTTVTTAPDTNPKFCRCARTSAFPPIRLIIFSSPITASVSGIAIPLSLILHIVS